MSKEKKRTKKTCKHFKERTKEKAPPKRLLLLLKEQLLVPSIGVLQV
jgi:hypothetical protein